MNTIYDANEKLIKQHQSKQQLECQELINNTKKIMENPSVGHRNLSLNANNLKYYKVCDEFIKFTNEINKNIIHIDRTRDQIACCNVQIYDDKNNKPYVSYFFF